ncbi:unnamed protein product [Rotaria sp. Silwood1]|nr:unnamed protein product [Rotaria sp. Silwood1]
MGGKAASKIIGTPSFDHMKSQKVSIGNRKKNLPIYSSYKLNSMEQTIPKTNKKVLQFVENVILVWLDSSLEKQTESNKSLINQFYRVTGIVKTFSNVNECFNFINSIEYEKIFLIVSGSLGRQISPLIENLDQLYSTYIFCGNQASHEEWSKQYKKIKSIHTKIKELCDAVKKDIRHYDRSITPISILPLSSIIELNDSNKDFINLQMVKSILISIEYDKKYRREFINYARQFYLNNEQQLNLIDKLDDNYSLHTPIWWYTRKCCLYSMLRKAFYYQNFEVIYKLAFFIRDLHKDIKKSHLQAHSHQHRAIIVYRATSMTNNELEHIQNSKGCLLSFNDFLSTTLERNIALRFVNLLRNDTNSIGIIYKIVVDPVSTTIPYIALNNLSYLSGNDGDILLSMNTIFRVGQIEQMSERLYEINLFPASKKDEEIKSLIEYIQDSLEGPSIWYKLCKVMVDLNEYDLAEHIYKTISTEKEDHEREERAYIQHELGYVCELKNDLSSAANYYKKAIEIYLTYLPENHPTILPTYINYASVLEKKGDLTGALNQYLSASKIDKTGDSNVIAQYNNIGRIFQQQKKYQEAEKTYEKAIEILLKDFSSNHPVLADTYYNLAGMYYTMKNYSKALSYYEQTCDIEEKSFIVYHPTLSSTYFNLATTFEALNDEQNAIKYATKAAETARFTFGNDHTETKENVNYLEQLQENSKTVKL